ncbi:MAG: heme o synthase [Gemmatimonadota bacterium]|nr:heme o synthase [Gemmatimonadota bacterium]
MKPRVEAGTADAALSWARLMDYLALTKPKITIFVVLSTTVGFVLGAAGVFESARLLHTLLATVLVASGSAVLNQFLERKTDARMERTASRPLPAGRLYTEEAYLFGLLLSGTGILYMGLQINWLAGFLAGLTTVIYLFMYTPLKRISTHNTFVGAVAGALPPMGGWAAAQGEIGGGAWLLFGILFLWQFPHFYSIAWIYRDDYASGGFKMISIDDPAGRRTARQIGLYSAILLAFSFLPWLAELTGLLYAAVAAAVGICLAYSVVVFSRTRSEKNARRLLRTTLVYLPLLWFALLFDTLL